MKSLANKKLFLFDIDGTLGVGDTLFNGTKELLTYIDSIGGQSYFITNNSTHSNVDYVNKFKNVFHLDAAPWQFITSGYITTEFLKANYPNDTIFVLGTDSFIKELQGNGLHITTSAKEGIACIVVAYDNELTYAKLTEASKALTLFSVPYYATNPDLRCPISFGFVPDCGAICEMLESTTGKAPIYLGKPNKEMVLVSLERSGFLPEETLVIGDRLYTDIACGTAAGVDTCVVYSGEATKEDVALTASPPSYAFPDINHLYMSLLHNSLD
ncbi:HAD-IIA family hydrolase [Lachnospiraceae bacterium OttesenSCG-928-D06]|nr:HAD-IIA family hydrolase [Lachnospiraceae bacterium OttesenSCG-928-D06]